MKQVFKHTLYVLSLCSFLFYINSATAQEMKKRKSPPAMEKASMNGVEMSINYSQPSVKDRKVWGGLVPYGKVWRTGANEATVFTVSKDVKIEGQTLAKGSYALFTIPGEKEWEFIFNSEPKQWGAFKHNADKDVLKVKVKPKKSSEFTEMMTFKMNDSGEVMLMWEKLEVGFTVSK